MSVRRSFLHLLFRNLLRYLKLVLVSLSTWLVLIQAIQASDTFDSITVPNLIVIPDSHHQVSRRSVHLDGVPATLTRYERRDGRNSGLEGEHFSTVIGTDGGLKGFINLSLDLVGKPQRSREESERIARAFLHEFAPDLLRHMRITSIAPYEESIRITQIERTEMVQITGMRIKARNTADESWFWVIIGGDGKPMLFERDLIWSNLRFRRSTEQWLYDRWIKEQGIRLGVNLDQYSPLRSITWIH